MFQAPQLLVVYLCPLGLYTKIEIAKSVHHFPCLLCRILYRLLRRGNTEWLSLDRQYRLVLVLHRSNTLFQPNNLSL